MASFPSFGPEAIRKNGGQYTFEVVINKKSVALPLINVGKETPVWIAYADVSANTALFDAALPAMVDMIRKERSAGKIIKAIVTPQSSKSEHFFRTVAGRLSLPLIQLIGAVDDPESVKRKAAPGLTTECVSVVSKAKGITKTIGMTKKDADLLQNLHGRIAWVDDVTTTGETRNKSFLLINRAINRPPDTAYPSFVIATESPWGPEYPKPFPEYHALYQSPEFIGKLPA